MVTRTMKTVLAGVTVLAVVGLGSGIAYAQDTDPAPPPVGGEPPEGRPGPDGHHRHFLGQVQHGEFTVRGDAGDKIVGVQRGTVTEVNGESITVQSGDGFSGTYAIDAETKVRKDGEEATIDQVATNDRVMVFAVKDGATATAKRIGVAEPAK